MPTYEYECTRCQLVFEEIRPITAPRRERCPKCRGKVERLISGGMGVVFKGSGFYKTDSRAKTGGDKGASAGEGAAPSGSPAAPATPKPPASES